MFGLTVMRSYFLQKSLLRDLKEFCLAEMKVHHIPVYLEDDMMEKLLRVSVT